MYVYHPTVSMAFVGLCHGCLEHCLDGSSYSVETKLSSRTVDFETAQRHLFICLSKKEYKESRKEEKLKSQL